MEREDEDTVVRSLFLRSLLLLLILSTWSGCHRKGATAAATIPLIENLSVLIETNSAFVRFDVIDPIERTWDAQIFFSDDLGQQWQPVTPIAGSQGYIELIPPFEPVVTEWSFRGDLITLPQADILVEVRLYDLEGVLHASSRSEPLSIGDPTIPSVDSVTIPSGPVGGPISISCLISDADGDFVTIHMEWSLDGNEPWNLSTLDDPGDVVIACDKGVSSVELIWLSHIDTPGVVSPFARVRIVATDAVGSSQATSNYLALNTIRPRIDAVTIGDVPDYLNGSEPYNDGSAEDVPFLLSVPTVGTLIKIAWSAGAGGAAADSSTVAISADQPIAGRGSGEPLEDLFVIEGSTASWRVSELHPLPLGLLTLTASIDDIRGNPAEDRLFEVLVTPGAASARPFDWQDRWHVDFQRDNYSIGLQLDQFGDFSPFATPGADGEADHRQDLLTVGLQSDQPTSAAAAAGTDMRVRMWVEQAIIDRMKYIFGETPQTGGEGLQPQLQIQTSAVGATSAIGIGGDDVDPYSYALGRATFDYRNSTANDERASNRGVFSSNMVQFYWNSWTFRNRFQEVLPHLGVPVGEHPLDSLVLGFGFERLDPTNSAAQNLRYDGVWDAVDAWSRINAVVAAHEVGHAVGLCANGAPPTGLFGGVSSADFTGPYTTSFHIDTPGLNVMSSALGLTSALVEGDVGYHLNPLNEAYIAEWTTLEP